MSWLTRGCVRDASVGQRALVASKPALERCSSCLFRASKQGSLQDVTDTVTVIVTAPIHTVSCLLIACPARQPMEQVDQWSIQIAKPTARRVVRPL